MPARSWASSPIIAACLAAAAIVTSADRALAAETITIGGTGSTLGDMKLLAEAYMRRHPDIKVVVLPYLGNVGGIRALRSGAVDIALTTEPLSPDEVAAGLTATPYAKTALAFATRPDTPIDAVTSAWLSDVYRGVVTQWPNGKPIRLMLRPKHDSDMKILFAYSDAMKKAMQAALERPGMLIVDNAQEAGKNLAQLEGSLGSTTLAQSRSEQIAIKLLALDGVAPTAEAVASGRYPLVKHFLFVTRPDASAATRGFITFLKTDEAAAILARNGNVVVIAAPRD
jgi:phosphate transport system substrate-binding protein